MILTRGQAHGYPWLMVLSFSVLPELAGASPCFLLALLFASLALPAEPPPVMALTISDKSALPLARSVRTFFIWETASLVFFLLFCPKAITFVRNCAAVVKLRIYRLLNYHIRLLFGTVHFRIQSIGISSYYPTGQT